MKQNQTPNLWSGQVFHFVALAVLLTVTYYLWIEIEKPHPLLFWLTIAVPIGHQIFVWISWRLELKSKAVSKSIGFPTYQIIFFLFLIGRPISFLLLAWSSRNTLGLNTNLKIIIAVILLVPAIYTMYSVKRYFGFERATGGDHFDLIYRNMPLVKKGIFKYSSNSMYVFGFLMFWGLAVALNSMPALAVSAFCHAYIWIHYFATEKPNMHYLYES